MAANNSDTVRQISEIQALRARLTSLPKDYAIAQTLISQLDDAIAKIIQKPLPDADITKFAADTQQVIKEAERLSALKEENAKKIIDQTIELQALRTQLTNLSTENPIAVPLVNNVIEQINNAIVELQNGPLAEERMSQFVTDIEEVRKEIPKEIERQKIVAIPTKTAELAPKRRRRAREITIEDAEDPSEVKIANLVAKSDYETTLASLRDQLTGAINGDLDKLKTIPLAQKLTTKAQQLVGKLDALNDQCVNEIRKAQENYPLAWDTKQPIKLVDKRMISNQTHIYENYLQALKSNFEINSILYEISEFKKAASPDLTLARQQYSDFQQSLSQYRNDFNKKVQVAHSINAEAEKMNSGIKELVDAALKSIDEAETLGSEISTNSLSTTEELKKYKEINIKLFAVIDALTQQKVTLVSMEEAVKQLNETEAFEATVIEAKQNALKNMTQYLVEANITPLPAIKDGAGKDKDTEIRLTTTLQNKVAEIKRLVTEINSIEPTISTKPIIQPNSMVTDQDSRLAQRRNDLTTYQKMINEKVQDFNGLKHDIAGIEAELTALKQGVGTRYLAIATKSNGVISELASALGLKEPPVLDLSPFQADIKEGKIELGAINIQHDAIIHQQQIQIETFQTELPVASDRLIDHHKKNLNMLLTTQFLDKNPDLKETLNTTLQTVASIEKQINSFKRTHFLNIDSGIIKSLQENQKKLDALSQVINDLKEATEEHLRHQHDLRKQSPEYTAMAKLITSIDEERKRIIRKYMAKETVDLLRHSADNHDPAHAEQLQKIYNEFQQVAKDEQHHLTVEEKSELNALIQNLNNPNARLDETKDGKTRRQRINDLIDPRLNTLQQLQTKLTGHQQEYLTTEQPKEVLQKFHTQLNDALAPEKLSDLADKRLGTFTQFIKKLVNFFVPFSNPTKPALATNSERNLMYASRKFKEEMRSTRRMDNSSSADEPDPDIQNSAHP